MRIIALLLAALVAWPGTAVADSADPPVPLLWKASNGERSVYLLGSFHMLKDSDYPLSPDIDAAFEDAESVLFEIAPEEMASATLALQMGKAALRTDGTLLDSQLPAATAARLQEWFEANSGKLAAQGLTPQILQRFEAWFVGLTVTLLGMGDAGLDPALGLDRHFAESAAAAGKPTGGLELGVEQIAFLDGMDADEQVQMLEEALANAAPGSDEIDSLHAMWRSGDVDALWDGMAVQMQRGYPKLYQRINVDRNANWLPDVEARLHGHGGDDTLVVVGALHLLGEDGLVAGLRARGYDVERICSACTVR